MLIYIIRSLRLNQWNKNLLLFAALVFSHNVTSFHFWLKTVVAFAAFCLLSGAVYLVNDVIDIDNDRLHPLKRQRPLASGQLSSNHAILVAVALFIASLTLSFGLSLKFSLVCAGYAILILTYSFSLKKIAVLDVIVIALGFVLRAVAGAVVIQVEISPWLLLCTMFLALFLVLSKRRHELVLLNGNAHNHRKSLSDYNTLLLDQMIAVVTAATVLAYSFYTMAPRTHAVVGTTRLYMTIPFVVFGIFRYLYLVYHKNQGGNPEILIFSDKPLLLNLGLWVMAVVVILYV